MGESSPYLSNLIEDDANYSSQIAKLVSYLVADNTCFLHAKCMGSTCRNSSYVNKKLQKGFAVSEGPFLKGVETALQSLNVQHQQ